VTVIEAEAAIIRQARDRVMADESPRSVSADLNDRGITSATGQPWTPGGRCSP
jgi:hypothetical protein